MELLSTRRRRGSAPGEERALLLEGLREGVAEGPEASGGAHVAPRSAEATG